MINETITKQQLDKLSQAVGCLLLKSDSAISMLSDLTLINDEYVATAAHVVLPHLNDLGKLVVHFPDNQSVYAVSSVVFHPRFDQEACTTLQTVKASESQLAALAFDLVLLKLAGKVQGIQAIPQNPGLSLSQWQEISAIYRQDMPYQLNSAVGQIVQIGEGSDQNHFVHNINIPMGGAGSPIVIGEQAIGMHLACLTDGQNGNVILNRAISVKAIFEALLHSQIQALNSPVSSSPAPTTPSASNTVVSGNSPPPVPNSLGKENNQESMAAKPSGPGIQISRKSSPKVPSEESQEQAPRPAAVLQTSPYHNDTNPLVKYISTIGRKGEGDGFMMEPSVVFSWNGRIFVGDSFKRDIQVFQHSGRYSGKFKPKEKSDKVKSSNGHIYNPSGISVDAKGRVCVTDFTDQYIRMFDIEGTFIKDLPNHQAKKGGLQGIFCDNTNLILVTDSDNCCIQVFQARLDLWMKRIGMKGDNEGNLKLPAQLACDEQGFVYVVDYGKSMITIFAKSGLPFKSFGGRGAINGSFNVPRGIAIDKSGRIYVSDSLNHRVQVFTNDGNWLYTFGGKGSEPGQFIGPSGLSIDKANDCLYIADRNNGRIQVFKILD